MSRLAKVKRTASQLANRPVCRKTPQLVMYATEAVAAANSTMAGSRWRLAFDREEGKPCTTRAVR